MQVLSDFYPEKKKCHEVCDQLWAGIMDKSEEINAGNIAALFSTLPHLRASREIVYKTLESKVGEFWQEYTTKDVLEILGVFAAMKMRTGEKVLRVLSQWLRVNVQTLSEGETLAVIYCLHNLEYIDDAIIREDGWRIQTNFDFHFSQSTALNDMSSFFVGAKCR